ncbi:MAG: hypothetical protein Q8R13_02065 [bacterium]|nr:hypothetical protein [bacterium]MDZ4296018.1 carbonic anhydrase [Patescibacteria group bacterium]
MQQTYIFSHETPLAHYTAQAFVLRCFDDRFFKTFKNFLKSEGLTQLDPESVAGGAKVIASPEKAEDRDFMLRELEKSIRLHHTARVMLFTHHDCGAYGGLARFGGDKEAEFAFHREEHRKAREIIAERFPEVTAETYFIDGQGVIRTIR